MGLRGRRRVLARTGHFVKLGTSVDKLSPHRQQGRAGLDRTYPITQA